LIEISHTLVYSLKFLINVLETTFGHWLICGILCTNGWVRESKCS